MIRRKTFDPRNVPSIEAWFDAADAATITLATGVRTWADKSGKGRTASQSAANSQPSLVANAIGSRPALLFDGLNDTLAWPSVPMSAWTLFAVCRRNSGVTNATVVQVGGGMLAPESAVLAVNNDVYYGPVMVGGGSTGAALYGIGGSLSAGTARLLTAKSTGSAYAAWANGEAITLGDSAATPNALGVDSRIGASWSGALCSFFRGHIAELLVYSTALADGPRSAVEAYLMRKWGL